MALKKNKNISAAPSFEQRLAAADRRNKVAMAALDDAVAELETVHSETYDLSRELGAEITRLQGLRFDVNALGDDSLDAAIQVHNLFV